VTLYMCMQCLSFVSLRGECSCTRSGKSGEREVSEFVYKEVENV
jgi:hypothetical protein